LSETIVLQYVGFETRGEVREYAFTRRESGGATSEYFVTIANAAFMANGVRYQDAPGICSLRLHREFARRDDLPSARFSITEAELVDYAASQKTKPGISAYRKDNES